VLTVSRVDLPNTYDSSGVGTAAVRYTLRVTFSPRVRDAADLTITALSGGSFTRSTVRAFSATGAVVPAAVPPSIPRDMSLTIVTDEALGLSFSIPTHLGGTAIDKFRIEWDTSRLFAHRDLVDANAWDHYISVANCGWNCTWDSVNGLFQYKIGDAVDNHMLTTGVPYFFRVSAHANGAWGMAKVSTPIKIAPTAQKPWRPTTVMMEVSKDNIAPHLDIMWTEPSVNDLNYPTFDGGATITAYRIEYDHDVSFNSGSGGGPEGCFDSLVFGRCIVNCTEVLGYEVQHWSIGAGVTITAGQYRLGFKGANTSCLAWDSLCASVEGGTGGLSTIGTGGVRVTRLGDGTISSDETFGYNWRVTFLTEALSLDQPEITLYVGADGGCTPLSSVSGLLCAPRRRC
jgi:hypothetical protein